MPELPWTGHWIEVDADGQPSWRRCAICNQPLTDPASRERGVGPVCVVEHDDQEQDAARHQARLQDRALWRMEARAPAHLLPGWRVNEGRFRTRYLIAKQAADRHRTRPGKPPPTLQALYEQDPDAHQRWLVFQAARRRRRGAS